MENPFNQAGIMSMRFFPDSGKLQLDDAAFPGVPAFSLNHLDGFLTLVAEPDRRVFHCVIRTLVKHLGPHRPPLKAPSDEWVLETGFRLGLANRQELQIQLLMVIKIDTQTKQPVWQWMIRELPAITKPSFWAVPHGPAVSLTQHIEGCISPKQQVKFTPAEMKIVRLLSNGLTPKEIAEKLDSPLGTVRTHIRNARKKAGVSNMAGLVNMAREAGLIDPT